MEKLIIDATDNDAEPILRSLRGLHMESPEAKRIMEKLEWVSNWPEVDKRGLCTGRTLTSDDDCIIVDWDGCKLTTRGGGAYEAAILRCNAPRRIVHDHHRETGD